MTAVMRSGMTATSRTIALLDAVGQQARDDWQGTDREALAVRHLVECLTRIVQAHPGVAEFAETYAARAAEALELVSVDGYES